MRRDWSAELRTAQRQNETATDLARRLGLNKSAVYQQIARYGISLRRANSGKPRIATDWAIIFAMREPDDNGYSIARKIGCSPVVVYRAARRLGITFK